MKKFHVQLSGNGLFDDVFEKTYDTSSLKKIRKDVKFVAKDAWFDTVVVINNYSGELLLEYKRQAPSTIDCDFIKQGAKILRNVKRAN